jgi:Ca-activated chloride channel family protein
MQEQLGGRSRAVGVLLAVALAVGVLLLVPAPAQAAPELAPVMVVLDSSGSMKESLAAGGNKMDAAKGAVRTLVNQSPEDAELGLTVYGTGTGSSEAEKQAGCKDVKVVHEVAKLDRGKLIKTTDGLQPRGYTPIGESLKKAADALPKEGKRSIVLVSDGEDTCAPPDPCEVAKQLRDAGVDLRVHAIGFDVDAKARKQLSCLAQATGGSYLEAPDAASLARALNRTTQQAFRAYEPVGIPVKGTKTPDGAPKLKPGAYLDSIARDETKFYTVDVPAGYTLYATATVILADSGDYLVNVSRYDPAKKDEPLGGGCSGSATEIKSDEPAASSVIRWLAPAASPGATRCDQAGEQIIQVNLDHAVFGEEDGAAALELQIGLEPPVTGDKGPAGTEQKVAFTEPKGEAQKVSGGGSYNTATTLDGSGNYADTVLGGEMVFYRVKLDWGQGLAYKVKLGRKEPGGYPTTTIVHTGWHNPARYEAEYDFDSPAEDKDVVIDDNGKPLSTTPVRYRNRPEDWGSSPLSLGPASIAGWYYISVYVDDVYHPDQPTPVPVTVQLSVTDKTEGAPAYKGEVKNPFGEQTGRAAGGRDGDDDGGPLSALANAGPLMWLGVPLFLLLLAAGAVVGLLLVRRRRRPAMATGPVPPYQPPHQPPYQPQPPYPPR